MAPNGSSGRVGRGGMRLSNDMCASSLELAGTHMIPVGTTKSCRRGLQRCWLALSRWPWGHSWQRQTASLEHWAWSPAGSWMCLGGQARQRGRAKTIWRWRSGWWAGYPSSQRGWRMGGQRGRPRKLRRGWAGALGPAVAGRTASEGLGEQEEPARAGQTGLRAPQTLPLAAAAVAVAGPRQGNQPPRQRGPLLLQRQRGCCWQGLPPGHQRGWLRRGRGQGN
mmetsp:Transcript_17629/g.49278  ORF Transcript_17629/g.49278 Transcript_17629/m.49278 type:complete len:223 (+) Transcript_17629:271-939(+)